MSCRKETGDISNDHISDQLVLEPEELVLTDVTAHTGLALFKAILKFLQSFLDALASLRSILKGL